MIVAVVVAHVPLEQPLDFEAKALEDRLSSILLLDHFHDHLCQP